MGELYEELEELDEELNEEPTDEESTDPTDDPVDPTPSAVTKVSDITVQDVANYLRIAELTTEDENYITTLLTVAKRYIADWTGLKEESLDLHPDFIVVVYVLVQDMYDTRAMYVDKSNVNKVVDTILGLHQRNLL